MKLFKKTYSFDKSEIFIIFLLFIFCGVLVFSVGIMTGKKMLEHECKIMLENSKSELLNPSLEEANIIDDNQVEKPTTELLNNKNTESKTELTIEEVKPETITKTNNEENIELAIKEVTEDIKNKFTVQISAFQNEMEAKKEALKIYKLGYKSVYYMPVKLAQKGIWYRIGVGFFPKKDSAEIFAELLKRQGIIESYLIRKI